MSGAGDDDGDGRAERRRAPSDGDPVEGPADRGDGTPPVDREAMIRRVHERAREIRRREVETAIEKLEARAELTDTQRETVEEMATSIVEGLLSTPETAMRDADEETLRAAMRVYGVAPGDEGDDAE